MAEVQGYGSEMRNDDDQDDSPEKCRERRRRRIEMRRFAIAGSTASSSSSSSSSRNVQLSSRSSSSSSEGAASNVVQFTALAPVVGVMSVAGRLREMEDAVSVRTNFCRPAINRNQPVHFFAVFDGHGGPHVAALCRQWMHVILEEEIMRVGNITAASASGARNSNLPPQRTLEAQRKELEVAWTRVLNTCFARMDGLVARECRYFCGDEKCTCHPNEVLFSGSTAVVVVLTQDFIIVANCGDSRAVLCCEGRPITLTIDHKPDNPKERARIEAAGGRVIQNEGARVEGILAMSRSIGDKYLKPVVTAEPEIFFLRRDQDDECLILGSDGLWDVMSDATAVEVARECLREEKPAEGGETGPGGWRAIELADPMFPTRSASAAALLTRLALGRRSYDNISVIVVDLKRYQMGR